MRKVDVWFFIDEQLIDETPKMDLEQSTQPYILLTDVHAFSSIFYLYTVKPCLGFEYILVKLINKV